VAVAFVMNEILPLNSTCLFIPLLCYSL